MNTNSLEPLSDTTTVQEIANRFNIGRNKVTPMINKFRNLGVFGEFGIVEHGNRPQRYWILNPYLSFSGKIIDSGIANYFKNTSIGLAYLSNNARL